ncbi:hypothetical protein [Heliobacterium chlorum]|nr:hypothetical protein [Heliobacterium chlorum]
MKIKQLLKQKRAKLKLIRPAQAGRTNLLKSKGILVGILERLA